MKTQFFQQMFAFNNVIVNTARQCALQIVQDLTSMPTTDNSTHAQ